MVRWSEFESKWEKGVFFAIFMVVVILIGITIYPAVKANLNEKFMKNHIKDKKIELSPPRIEVQNPKYDFGTISQKQGIVSTLFTVKNTGGSDLIIDGMDTSCMCTSASLIYKGKEGPRFGMSMHGDNPEDYKLTIPPGDSAELKVYYDPMAHGIQKEPKMDIIREVTIVSNDPVDFQKKVRIELTQVP